ncbi:MAG: hypothetical protein Q4C96_02815 [Planctomycetia bacterium]|nr:hypothetical protein [Planctomycetia bacterium]
MTKRFITSIFLFLLCGMWSVTQAQTFAPATLTVSDSDSNANYFILSVSPAGDNLALPGSVDIVVLLDTSAGMIGAYRQEQEEALQEVLHSMKPSDRIQILVSDVNTFNYMENGFVSGTSPEVAVALEKYSVRVPLGSIDMQKALTTAAACFAAPEDFRGRVIVYIGQGSSRAKAMRMEEFTKQTDTLAEQRISSVCVPVGPNINMQLLGILAAKTGGALIRPDVTRSLLDTNDVTYVAGDLTEIGRAIHEGVFWVHPNSQTHPPEMKLFPAQFPPLRSDRETIVIGTLEKSYDLTKPVDISLTMTDGKKMSYHIQPVINNVQAYTAKQLVEIVQEKNTWLPLVEQSDINNAMGIVQGHLDSLLELAEEAITSEVYQPEEARKILENAKTVNPSHPKITELEELLEKTEQEAQNYISAAPNDGLYSASRANFNEAADQSARVDVQRTIKLARDEFPNAPERAVDDLKLKMEEINARDISPEMKDTLKKQLQAAIREGQNRNDELKVRQDEEYARLGEMRDRLIAVENTRSQNQKIKSWMRRFDSMMEAGNYRAAEEDVAAKLAALQPDNQTAVAAVISARVMGYHQQSMQTKVRRQKAFIDAMMVTEESNIPFPDNIAIQYPDSETWKRLTERRLEKYRSIDLATRGPAEKEIMEALDNPTSINATEKPLSAIIEQLAEDHKIDIHIDQTAVENLYENGAEELFTLNVNGISLRSALKHLLKNTDPDTDDAMKLTFVVQDEVLMITSKENATGERITRVYPVADLVLPIETLAPMGGGVIGGGSGSSGSGSGSSIGSTNMGGGNNMFGGGGNNGLFCIEDDLIITSKKTSKNMDAVKSFTNHNVPEVKSQKPVLFNSAEKARRIMVPKDVDVKQWWNDYFKALREKSDQEIVASMASVQKTLHWMMHRERYEDSIIIIESAILNDMSQSWMYEVLPLAMLGANRSEEEVERAILSAQEFCESPDQMMFIAAYLSRLGFTQRALDIYRQLGEIFPDSPEPFLQGLNLAKRADVNNEEGIRWASLGLLRLELSSTMQAEYKTARRLAQALLEKYKAEGRISEAEQFEKELALVTQRDCEITVSWTGEADIDLIIEEPNGSVCSLRNPRTVGGGFLKEDSFSKKEGRVVRMAKEKYICSQGFNGEYKILAKKIWGTVTDNKVMVEIALNLGTENEKRMRYSITLENDVAAAQFCLENGRRKESLKEQQLAATVQNLRHVQNTKLAQQLFQNIDPRAMANLSSSGSSSSGSAYPYYYYGNEGVGYRPEITWLPTGAQMSATGVISADRRYVRITAAPIFSSVPKVTVFNFATGEYSSYDPNEEPDNEGNDAAVVE